MEEHIHNSLSKTIKQTWDNPVRYVQVLCDLQNSRKDIKKAQIKWREMSYSLMGSFNVVKR